MPNPTERGGGRTGPNFQMENRPARDGSQATATEIGRARRRLSARVSVHRRTLAGAAALPPIVLLKSKVADLRIFRENTEREAIADSYNLNRVTEVACEINVRRRGPPHLYTKATPGGL
jgi:hypothetical protein